MATLEEILAQYLQPPVLPSEAVAAPADKSYVKALTDTNATPQRRLDAIGQGLESGDLPSNAATLTQVNSLQTLSDEQETAYANSASMIDSMMKDVDFLLADDAYKTESGQNQALADTIFGNISKSARGVLTGGKSLDVRKRITALGSKAFLVNYEKLKGAGAISNAEGERAQAALSSIFGKENDGSGSIDLGMSEEGMKAALLELQDVLKKGQDRLQKGLRWDEEAGKAIDSSAWLEKYRGQPKADGSLPTDAEANAIAKKGDFPEIEDSNKINDLKVGDQFYYKGQLYKRGVGKTVSKVTQ
jgi:hypothetical protein